jgi:hypothetical protein
MNFADLLDSQPWRLNILGYIPDTCSNFIIHGELRGFYPYTEKKLATEKSVAIRSAYPARIAAGNAVIALW